MRRYTSTCLAFLLLFACRTEQSTTQVTPGADPWPYGVNYEVFVLAFADANNDTKGDIPGLTGKLDYLRDLGIGGLWLMPVMPSPSYHKYDVTDYKGVHPDYGTISDFRNFVQAAHERGIQVIIDLVMNHSSSDHPWFKEAVKGKSNPYRKYYVWANYDSIAEVIKKKTTALDSDNIQQWYPVNGDTNGEYYYAYFWGGMPDLNFDNPKVKQEFVDIGKFWLNEIGVDGFRLDAARHIFPTDRAADNHAFWVWFRSEMQKIKPDVYLVGEVWSSADVVAPYLKGLPSLFNFDLGYAITAAVSAGQDNDGLVSKYKGIIDTYKNITSDYVDATFLKNHDQNRITSELGDPEGKSRVAASVLFSLPGTPYLYYGEEIGMKGMKPDEYIREPFIWDQAGNDRTQTSWEVPRYSTDKTVVPLKSQRDVQTSLYNFYKKWITYRNSSPVLTLGSLDTTVYKDTRVISLVRRLGEEQRMVLHNITGSEVSVPKSGIPGFSAIDFTTAGNISIGGSGITLPPYSSVILK